MQLVELLHEAQELAESWNYGASRRRGCLSLTFHQEREGLLLSSYGPIPHCSLPAAEQELSAVPANEVIPEMAMELPYSHRSIPFFTEGRWRISVEF